MTTTASSTNRRRKSALDDEHFKLLRRNSLHQEVEGVWDAFEDLEDESLDLKKSITHSECVMLNRVLSDSSRVPKVCQGSGSDSKPVPVKAHSDAKKGKVGVLAKRLSGAAPGAFEDDDDAPPAAPHRPSTKLGGPVGLAECKSLQAFLAPSVGGLYLMPAACTAMIEKDEEDNSQGALFERQNEQVYAQLKKRSTEMGKRGFPPTMC